MAINNKKKQQILDKLHQTIVKMRQLEDDQFYFGAFVSAFDSVNKCATTACVAGWYPKWFPESPFEWEGLSFKCRTHESVLEGLAMFHDIKKHLVHLLFMPGPYPRKESVVIKDDGTTWERLNDEAELWEVIKVWESVYKAIQEGQLDKYLGYA